MFAIWINSPSGEPVTGYLRYADERRTVVTFPSAASARRSMKRQRIVESTITLDGTATGIIVDAPARHSA